MTAIELVLLFEEVRFRCGFRSGLRRAISLLISLRPGIPRLVRFRCGFRSGLRRAISLLISLRPGIPRLVRFRCGFRCGLAFLVWCDVNCREAAPGVPDERGLSERGGLVRHSEGQPAEDVFIRAPVP